MSLRQKLKRALPPVLLDELRRVSGGGIRFSGDYANWAEATAAATGYDTQEILQRVQSATRAVVAGQAAFERDSVLFTRPAYSYPLLAALLRAAALNGGRLNVIDFGGSLGSTYRQHRPFLAGLNALRWCVVEQPHFVAAGRQEFTTDELGFADTVQQVPWWGQPCVVLLSSVLQYLDDPLALLEQLQHSGATGLVIDRTPVAEASRDRLCVQTVPPQIYSASYPCRIFARAPLLRQLARHWELLAEFPCEEGSFATRERFRFTFVGLICEAHR
jgi:putative methyltransferase (TIGR04325 family)